MPDRSLLLASALIGASFLMAAPARAQETNPEPPPESGQQAGQEIEATQVEEIVVQGTRPDIVFTADRMIFDVRDDILAQTGSVADVLRNVPGVEVDLEGNVSLRGDTGVTILIDGRPSGMLRGEGRADVLRSMSGAQIERVEVMTNPSAAFSPEGSGGVINLITRARAPSARSASIRGSWDLGDQASVSLSGSRTDEGLTLAGDLGLRRDADESDSRSERLRFDDDAVAAISEISASEGVGRDTSANGRLSIDYDLNARDRLSGELSFRAAEGDDGDLELFERASDGDVVDRIERRQDGAFESGDLEARVSWRRKFDDDRHELVADFEAESESSSSTEELHSDTLAGDEPGYFQKVESESQEDSYGVDVDYTRPMGERRLLRIGYEGDVEIEANASFGARGPDEASLSPIAALTNAFDYEEWVHAAYATYERPFGDLDFQAGLRLEQVWLELTPAEGEERAEQDYFRAYPTVNFAYQLADSQTLRGGYSRRIDRPSPRDLNPFTVFIDPQNLRRGNPDLEPEITDSFELGWSVRRGEAFYSVTGFYRDSSGGITDVVEDLGDGVLLTTRRNLAQSEQVGAEFIANGEIGPDLSYNLSGSIYRNEIVTPGLGEAGRRSGATGRARASVNWQPTDRDFFQLSGFWSGERVQAQGRREPFGILNLGYRRKVSDALSLVVTGSNVLDSAEFVRVIDTPDFRQEVVSRFSEPTYYIGFTYSFGAGDDPGRDPGFDFGQDPMPG